MQNITIPVDIPSDLMLALNETEEELKSHFQTTIAIMFFKEGKLTIGKAIQLSGLSRFEFEKALAKSKIATANLDYDQVMADVEKLKDL